MATGLQKANPFFRALQVGLLIFLAALLTGCQGSPAVNVEPTRAPLSCLQMLEQVIAAQPFHEQTVLSHEVLCKYLMIEDEWVADSAMSMDATYISAEHVVVLTAKDQAALENLRGALTQYLADVTEQYRDYQPTEMPKLQNAVLYESGLRIALVVSADAQKAMDALKNAL